MDRRTDLDSGIDDLISHNLPPTDEDRWSPPLTPKPLPVIVTDEEHHSFTLDENALEHILLRPDVADLHVAIVSVAGAFRKGKSFLLNFFLRYLDYQQSKESDDTTYDSTFDDDWLGDEHRILQGFSWRGGCERETSGMHLWSEPFVTTLENGQKVAILLMDTQGAFDSQSTVKDCATVFALSTMVSSIQVFNLSQNMQEDDLQHLQLFTEYGRLALESNNFKPFQNLVFLIRDWSFPYEANYGYEGGRKILDRRLQILDKQHPELQQLRKHIKNCFTNIECFLMPHPGLKVATSAEFKGQLSDVEKDFKDGLRELIPEILTGKHFLLKEINGEKVTCRELLQYFRAYIKIFQGEELPEPKSMLIATAEANNLAAVASAKASYSRKMEEICGGDTPYIAAEELEERHKKFKNDALRQFNNTRKMGGAEFSETFLQKLDAEIIESYDNFVKNNNGKNFFRSARTPAVFFVGLVVVYLLQEVFQLLYMDVLASLCSTTLGLILLTMCVWFYARYSGSLREIGQTIDELANILWENVLFPFSQFLLQEGVKHASSLQRFNETQPNSRASSRNSAAVQQRR